ncbi:MAG: histidinol dehydrogenase [Firmicutes bacterium]|nr:histidinol dehydrogenase [Bacillota bacterium]
MWQVISYSKDTEFDQSLLNRGLEFDPAKEAAVREILEAVRQKGDAALLEYTAKFDGVELTSEKLQVSAAELDAAQGAVSTEFLEAVKFAAERIRRYHRKQLPENWSYQDETGAVLGRRYLPLRRVGVYVPGGRAPYPSSVLMNVIPPQVAGVEEICLVTPPGPEGTVNPHILAAAKVLGVKEIYRIGGAQAIAAMAFGTETIPRVDKICGPGNIYVTIAKKLVYGNVGIDMLAGPSEIAVVADETANPVYVAADLLSQAEHDPEAGAFLFTTSLHLAKEVEAELIRQLAELERAETARQALKRWGRCILVSSLDEAIELVNILAPEHLELYFAGARDWLEKVKAAGTVFIGGYTPEPLGDYASGTNHVLPTHGTARFSSGLSVDDFLKRMSYSQYGPEALEKLAPSVLVLAETEGFTAHANAVRVRLKEDNNE